MKWVKKDEGKMSKRSCRLRRNDVTIKCLYSFKKISLKIIYEKMVRKHDLEKIAKKY